MRDNILTGVRLSSGLERHETDYKPHGFYMPAGTIRKKSQQNRSSFFDDNRQAMSKTVYSSNSFNTTG